MQDDSRLIPTTPAQPGTRRPGGRTARTKAAVSQAALAELTEYGYAGASLERIAARAGVALSTVYRRWGTLEALLTEVADQLTVDIVMPDTGDLESDLRFLARAIVTLSGNPAHRAWLDGMVSAAVRDSDARHTLSDVLDHRVRDTSIAVRRAIDRGEVPPDTCLVNTIRWVAAPLYQRMYLTDEPIDLAFADRCAAVAALAARSGLLRLPF